MRLSSQNLSAIENVSEADIDRAFDNGAIGKFVHLWAILALDRSNGRSSSICGATIRGGKNSRGWRRARVTRGRLWS